MISTDLMNDQDIVNRLEQLFRQMYHSKSISLPNKERIELNSLLDQYESRTGKAGHEVKREMFAEFRSEEADDQLNHEH